MTFYETRFPTRIGANAQGGPSRVVDIVTLRSGFEEANAIWANSRRKWDVSYGIRSLDDLHDVITLWEAMGGRLHQFRFRDPSDWKSCAPLQTAAFADQALGTGDGATVEFQLIKTYSIAGASYARTIKKPVSGTVSLGLDGAEVSSGWAVDTTTGIVTFAVAPATGQTVTAGFEFDVPVRFSTDSLSTNIELYKAGTATVELLEVKV